LGNDTATRKTAKVEQQPKSVPVRMEGLRLPRKREGEQPQETFSEEKASLLVKLSLSNFA
jgi:hypothetical protein